MGTTQRIGSGVKNDPKWGALNSSATSIANAVSDLQAEDKKQPKDEQEALTQERRFQQLGQRRDVHAKNLFDRLISTAGGSNAVSSGSSSKIGKAGIRSSRKIAGFFSGVASGGLQSALNDIGFGSVEGKTVRDVTDYLIAYCSDTAVGMDETASNKAMNELLRKIEAEADGDMTKLEQAFSGYVDQNTLSELLCEFFGVYIYEYISERIEERLMQTKGEGVTRETFECIKKDIKGRVDRINLEKPLANIDWAGEEGYAQIEQIFQSIIKIEES